MTARFFSRIPGVAALATVLLLLPVDSSAQARGKILHGFSGERDGMNPAGRLVGDGSGNLYGASTQGTQYGGGIVFELSPIPPDGWTGRVLYTFKNFDDGGYVWGLVRDQAGNLYGMTDGGSNRGTVFKVSPGNPGQEWTKTTLYEFCPLGYGTCTDGDQPLSHLTFDSQGNLYGTTPLGGDLSCQLNPGGGCGVVFKLTPSPNGMWTQTVLHAFSGKDGFSPWNTGLIFDSGGNLYGATTEGADLSCPVPSGDGCGLVFELSPENDGSWTETVLHVFHGDERGSVPLGDLVFDSAGKLYGTTLEGGDLSCSANPSYGCGIVFQLSPEPDGKWTEQVLHTFTGPDGVFPVGELTFDPSGNLYGVAEGGGYEQCPYNPSYHGCGTVFELVQNPLGLPRARVLRFNGKDGTYPQSGVVLDAAGNLYGTAWAGGPHGGGVVYEVYAPDFPAAEDR
ncbi:MAG: hypothetical protein LAO09_15425 [Acidobacteriia bacterium]|nr:hypothetical protein [Terriglobia bacterium]